MTKDTTSTLRAGAARVDISPPIGAHLAGDIGAYRPAEKILDPLYARALVVESGGRKICFLALDVTIITRPYTRAIREGVRQRCGLEADAVMVHATQTHSAPSIGHFMIDDDFPELPAEFEFLRGGRQSYCEMAVGGAIEAIARANEKLEAVEVAAASGIEGRLAFNRRAVGHDGHVTMPYKWTNLLGPTHIRYIEGPMDPELGVLALRGEDGAFHSLLLNYTCHPVHVFPQLAVSADWPGAWADDLQNDLGAGCLPIVLNGACGNINPWPPFDPDYRFNGDHVAMGQTLAATSRKVIDSLAFEAGADIDFATKHIRLPYQDLDAGELEEAHRYLDANPLPVPDDKGRVPWQWTNSAWLVSRELERKREVELDYEIQVLRIGDTAFVGLPGEPFEEGGIAIKMASPFKLTYIVHCTTQYIAYLPTQEAIPRGGHEVVFSKFVPDALDRIVAAAGELLQEVFDRTTLYKRL